MWRRVPWQKPAPLPGSTLPKLPRTPSAQQLDLQREAGVIWRIDSYIAPHVRTQATHFSHATVGSTPRFTTLDRDFVDDLKRVTADLIREQACSAVLQTIAPKEAPKRDPRTEQTAKWTDAALEAGSRLARRYDMARLDALIDGTTYTRKVSQDAHRLAANYSQYEQYEGTIIRFSFYPSVRGSVALYLRTCYSPPRSLTSAFR
jgi:hypothetical protein